MYQALYRKWRPGSFDDVVGQEHITSTLKNEIAAGKPSHAYLFCGTRGTGKTTCSKILAKAVNCPDCQDGNPCGKCGICQGVDDGSILDVTEIDAASNSGVDNIRDLREEAFFTPAVCAYRVYIIDEAHMLSVGAFNALLKIMEEPPAHVLFILATTEIHKVPATILSRCQRFDFRRIPSAVIAGRLLDITKGEEFTLDPPAAELIARLSDGGMRDAISLLDLAVSSTSHVTVQAVKDCAGLVDQEHLFEIAAAAESGDSGAMFSVLERLWGLSVDYQRLCEQLIGFYRNLMVAKSVPDPGDLIACLPEELERYKSVSGTMPIDTIMNCLDVLQNALIRMSRVSARRTELEMSLLKLCAHKEAGATSRQGENDAKNALISRIERLERQLEAGIRTSTPKEKHKRHDPVPDNEEIARTEVEPFKQWPKVLELLKTKNGALYGALAESGAYLGGDLLLIDAGELFAKMMREDGYTKESLRDALLTVTGQKYRMGPYNATKYEVKESTADLDNLLMKASELGVDVQVKQS